MPNATLVGWRKVTIKSLKNFMINKPPRPKNFLKFEAEVHEAGHPSYWASALVEPTLVPGRALYQWMRACGIPLTAIDDKINPALFIGKEVHAKIVANGDFYNITDVRQLSN